MTILDLAPTRSKIWSAQGHTAGSSEAVVADKHVRIAGFVALVSVSALLGWRSITALVQTAWQHEPYTYVLMILPVSLCLLLLERRATMPLRSSRAAGILLLSVAAPGILGATYSASLSASSQLSVVMLALVTCWMGAFVLCFGAEAFKALCFPLLFLFLLVPLPGFVVQGLVYFLQIGSTEAAHVLFKLFGIPASQNGFVLSLPGVDIEIAEECSGIRSSTILMISSLALSHLCLRSRWNQALVAMAVLPLAILKNGLRVFTLSTLAIYVDASWFEGRLHRSGGVLFFALALAMASTLIALLRRLERNTPRSERVRAALPHC